MISGFTVWSHFEESSSKALYKKAADGVGRLRGNVINLRF